MTSKNTFVAGGLISAAFVLVLVLAGCDAGSASKSESGVSAQFSVALHPTPNVDNSITALPAGNKTFGNSEGITITITRAYIDIGSVELESDCGNSEFAQLPQKILGWFIPTANAHSASTPTRIGEPHVISITGADLEAIELGSIAPAAGTYCGATVELTAADDDATGLPDDADMIGRSVHIEGSYSKPGDGSATAFSFNSSVDLEHAHRLFAGRLTLNSGNRSADIIFDIYYQDWFNGVDPAMLADPAQTAQLLANISESVKIGE